MSVIVTLTAPADPKKMEEAAQADPANMTSIIEQAKSHGLIAHRFYGSHDGARIMVIDEWPDAESFQRFFEEAGGQIQPLMAAGGVTAPPEITFWHKLYTGDDVGWNAA